MGAVLPLAGPAMYGNLGANWAASLCGFLLVLIVPTPFIFYRYGSRFRKRSALIQEMREELDRLEGKRKRRSTAPDARDVEKALEAASDNAAQNEDAGNGSGMEAHNKEVEVRKIG